MPPQGHHCRLVRRRREQPRGCPNLAEPYHANTYLYCCCRTYVCVIEAQPSINFARIHYTSTSAVDSSISTTPDRSAKAWGGSQNELSNLRLFRTQSYIQGLDSGVPTPVRVLLFYGLLPKMETTSVNDLQIRPRMLDQCLSHTATERHTGQVKLIVERIIKTHSMPINNHKIQCHDGLAEMSSSPRKHHPPIVARSLHPICSRSPPFSLSLSLLASLLARPAPRACYHHDQHTSKSVTTTGKQVGSGERFKSRSCCLAFMHVITYHGP